MIQTVGELYSPVQKTLVKMWHVQVPPGKRPLQRHFHTRFEITLIQAGGGIYTTDSGEHPLKPGDIFVFSSNEFHSITDVAPEGLTITNLHFEPYFLQGKNDDILSEEHLNICYAHSPVFQNRIPAENAEELRRLFHAIEAEMTEQGSEFALSVRSYLHLFMVYLIRNHQYASAHRPENISQIKNLLRALQYIDMHFADNLTLQTLAGLVGLTPTYFSALFKQAFHVTPWEYILTKRIERAIHLLLTEQKELNMLEIAVLCGFNNTANFNKQFKKQTGMTPSQYRDSKEILIH